MKRHYWILGKPQGLSSTANAKILGMEGFFCAVYLRFRSSSTENENKDGFFLMNFLEVSMSYNSRQSQNLRQFQ